MRYLHCSNRDEHHARPAEERSQVDDNFGTASQEVHRDIRNQAVNAIALCDALQAMKFEQHVILQVWLTTCNAASTSAMSLPRNSIMTRRG